jgi:hypothetical protein
MRQKDGIPPFGKNETKRGKRSKTKGKRETIEGRITGKSYHNRGITKKSYHKWGITEKSYRYRILERDHNETERRP